MKLRATLVWEYDLTDDLKEREATYGTINPFECAEVDNGHGPQTLVEACFGYFGTNDAELVKAFTVEPVEEA